jgi:pimeloyl-ACP methyl ester carboxylesterase
MSIKHFKVNIPQTVLDDLYYRLEHTRWPDEAPNAGWAYGTSLSYMRDLTIYWFKQYDWRKHEKEINQLPQFTSDVNNVNIHFVHQPSKNPNAIPVLLVHGWPDSYYRFHKVLPLLTDKFHVVIPSMPGTGFSERISLSIDKIADLFTHLMIDQLGYKKFVSAGGDGGSLVSLSLARRRPEILLGMHLTDVGYPDYTTDFASLTPPEQEFAGFIQRWWMTEGAFSMVNATKPQSAAYAFNDSPVGLAAWIMSMMSMLSTGEEIDRRFGRDELLTNIMIYWVTQTIGSSMRIAYETRVASMSNPVTSGKSPVPAGVAHCPGDAPLPREWAERQTNLIHYSNLERGAHFVAWEAPEIWTKDFIEFTEVLSTYK